MKHEMLVELYDVARLMRTRFDRWARTYGMTRAQGIILARLSRQPGMTQNEMAGVCEVEPITVGRLVDRLEARGLLERRLDPADRRIRRLHLLPAAEPILQEIQRYKDELFRETTIDLDPATVETDHRCAAQDENPPDTGARAESRDGRRISMSAVSRTASAYQAAPRQSWSGALWADKARLRKILMFGGVGIFLAIAGAVYLMGGRYVASDDFYVHANKLMVSTDVSGLVKTVDVHEGQSVKAGQVLFTLDPLPFQIALDNAKAALASTAQDVEFHPRHVPRRGGPDHRRTGAGYRQSADL